MDKTLFLLIIAFALVMGFPHSPNRTDTSSEFISGRPSPQSIHLIGNVDGKSIFADDISNLNWVQSSAYCEGMGMRLASITSPAQATLLFNSFNIFFNGTFWTSGRDAHQFRQFSWNDTETQPNSTYLTFGEKLDTYLTCLAYHSTDYDNPSFPHLDIQPCSLTFGVLCETV